MKSYADMQYTFVHVHIVQYRVPLTCTHTCVHFDKHWMCTSRLTMFFILNSWPNSHKFYYLNSSKDLLYLSPLGSCSKMQQDARFSKPHTAVFPMTIHASYRCDRIKKCTIIHSNA